MGNYITPDTLPNWALVFVGIGGIAAALCTLNAINKQTAIQTAAMKQWISTKDWTGIPYEEVSAVTFAFNIFNPTNFPLTLKLVKTFVDGNFISEVRPDHLMPPKEGFPVAVPTIDISKSTKVITVTGTALYIDAMGNQEKQAFGMVCVYADVGWTFTPCAGTGKSPTKHNLAT